MTAALFWKLLRLAADSVAGATCKPCDPGSYADSTGMYSERLVWGAFEVISVLEAELGSQELGSQEFCSCCHAVLGR